MSRGRTQEQWLTDIVVAVAAIRRAEALQEHLDALVPDDIADLESVVADTLTLRIMAIGEAVKHLDANLTAQRPEVSWQSIVRMRDLLSHHYHRRDLAVIRATVDDHLGPLSAAVEALLTTIDVPRESSDA